MDIWVWISVFILAWLLEALASAARKRQQQQQRQQRLRVPARGAQSVARPVVSRGSARPSSTVPKTPRAPLVVQLPPTARSREGVSAEELVAAPPPESTHPAHMRVQEKYGLAPTGDQAPGAHRARHRLARRPGTLRDAVVWSEILGRPTSER